MSLGTRGPVFDFPPCFVSTVIIKVCITTGLVIKQTDSKRDLVSFRISIIILRSPVCASEGLSYLMSGLPPSISRRQSRLLHQLSGIFIVGLEVDEQAAAVPSYLCMASRVSQVITSLHDKGKTHFTRALCLKCIDHHSSSR